jgi:hypothetical protein
MPTNIFEILLSPPPSPQRGEGKGEGALGFWISFEI